MPTAHKIYKFSEFILNPVKRTLFQGNDEIILSDKDFDVLLFLIENALTFCSFDEIIKEVWNGTNVHNNSVEKIIANIRKALGDEIKNPRFIKTRRGKGYSFICDVQEVEEKISAVTYENLNISQPQKVDFIGQPRSRKTLNSKLLAFCLVSIIILLFSGLFWWKSSSVLARFSTTAIFADDFSGEEIDHNHWTAKGNTVKVENGIAKLTVEETDNWGKLESNYFSFDPNKPITIKSRIKVAYSQNIKNKTYFVGSFFLLPKTPRSEGRDSRDSLYFGISFANYDCEGIPSPNRPIVEIKTEGFFLVKNGGRPHEKNDYVTGKVSERIEPVWKTWFEQKMIYEPFSGKMDYFINDELKGSFNVGELPPDLQENKLRLIINPWGWWLYHSIEIDYIEVTQ
jgi:DNA-binding winged helix-turn-helix (wHTH) protein